MNDPVLFVSLDGGEADDSSTEPFTVDTGKAGNDKREQPKGSLVLVMRLSVCRRKKYTGAGIDKHEHAGQRVALRGHRGDEGRGFAGKNWMKLVPKEPLDIGEYALVEILSPKEINLQVWDFRVDPASPENLNARLPINPKQH